MIAVGGRVSGEMMAPEPMARIGNLANVEGGDHLD
jgi:hypothetical protein